ncbi:TPA: class C sortase [Streptococcus suis]|uniref:Class C sortase n=1 Tax=Streptococcus suis TaxID=1307 RepID=A0AAP6DWT0_STRSU|nr:class C sortase [Streptococcus suis]MBS8066150.1 class C sortase [Streptococcus suis]MBS8080812.1 class C sortase [Streptococcus suis]MBS8083384.1 class C sortase [Streptococcus suis]MBS8110783.1 class C sortase [Streptococcus suis]MCB2907367.1 class C sortase [Streptococcus suis]
MMKRSQLRKGISKQSILLKLLFLFGLVVTLYPWISQYYYRYDSDYKIQSFYEQAQQLPSEEVLKRLEHARAYNQTLEPHKLQDLYTEEEKAGVVEYARMLEVKEKIGFVEIPKINERIPIYAGTTEEVLQKGAGHLEGSSLPVGGESTHTVITAHRGLPNASLFTNLDHLKVGDQFYIHNIAEVLAYEVDQILVVEPNNFDPVIVQNGKDYATLLTCTPYMINSHRLLVRGHRVPYEPKVAIKQKPAFFLDMLTLSYLVALLIIVVIVIILYLLRRKKYQKGEMK